MLSLHAVGIEIGSLYVKGVGLDRDGAIGWRFKARHQGDVQAQVDRCLREVDGRSLPVGIAARSAVALPGLRFDPAVCLAVGATSANPGARNILEVGGSSLTLAQVDESGQILSLHRNSLCAAGTGSFLDEQAARLGLDPAQLNGNPFPDPPSVATRCAVFAKSDLVHRQQEGYSREVVWSGLCRGLAEGVWRTLTCGRPLSGLTVVCGGVALNRSFVWWLERCLANGGHTGQRPTLEVMRDPEFAVALGAALQAAKGGRPTVLPVVHAPAPVATPSQPHRPPLRLVRSTYPDAAALSRHKDAEGNELGLDRESLGAAARHRVFLGTDIGSTSTKCALVDEGGRILLDVYRPTAGDPIGATRALFKAMLAAGHAHGVVFDVLGAATTGSGRKLVGKIVGADLVVNEISAHGTGAIRFDPSVETIFEIGGQDAKYLSVERGRIVDANMNYVCAAGTGSFVEEVASKLGYQVDEVGDAVLGVTPPFTSSRCTVFMEQDVLGLLRTGTSRREALGAVLYSVVENYIERVVGRRRVSRERVFFQGATARNRGLVAAIENLLGVEVMVSPYCHVMGAYGAALLVREALRGRPTVFRGLDLAQRAITLETEDCTLCANRCRLSRAVIEGEADRPAWGMLCGRDEHDTKMRVPAGYALYRKRMALAGGIPAEYRAPAAERRVGLPRALSTYSFSWFWAAFFKALGADTMIGPPTDDRCLEAGKWTAGSDLCLPIKAAHGHVAGLLGNDQVDAVFVPHMIADRPRPGVTGSKLCPYVEVFPSLVRAALKARGVDLGRLVSPVVDLSLDDRITAGNLADALRPLIRAGRRQVTRALGSAREARLAHEARLGEMGREKLQEARASGRPVFVVIGRPYTTLDAALSMEIPYHLADSGYDVIPMDCLDTEAEALPGDFANMFWASGQRILSALMTVARTDGLYAVYLTSFGCGPDSFLLSYAEALMGRKPFLVLELDDHGSSGGYETRVDAFLDVVRADRARGSPPSVAAMTVPHEPEPAAGWKSRTLWIAPMHAIGYRLLAAAFRGAGIDARPLPPEDDASYALGKRCTRGGECLPAPLTLGSFLTRLDEERRAGRDPERHSALFMPTCSGPCRFGQYRTLQRLALDRLGYTGVPIVSPTGNNTYYDVEPGLRERIWEALVASDILFKMRCRTLPYEVTRGDTAQILAGWTERLEAAISAGPVDWDETLGLAMRAFLGIPVRREFRPLVGIVGEIYVRSNAYANNHLIERVEELGGEAWLAPMGEWIEYNIWLERFLARRRREGLRTALYLALKWRYLHGTAHRMHKPVLRMLHDRLEPGIDRVMSAGRRLLPAEFEGEAILSAGRSLLFEEDGASLVVNCAPFSCMQGNITTALFDRLRDAVHIPIVNMFYDGAGDHNHALVAFLEQAVAAGHAPRRGKGA